MKKNILSYTFLLFVLTNLFAQKEDKFRFGYYGGINLAFLKNSDDFIVNAKQKGLFSLHGGTIAQYNINSDWAINFLTGLNTKGAKWNDIWSNSSTAWRLHYFSFIPQIRHNFKIMYFELGTELSRLVLHSNKEFNGKWSKETFPFVKKRDIAMQIGLGFKLNQQSSLVLSCSRSLLNISDSFPGDFGNFETNDYYKNLVFQLSYQQFVF